MKKKLYLAFFFHHHQPIYKDTLTNEYHLPFVLLHATKDYYDIAKILDDYPDIKFNFNFTPSLILQLKDYASGMAKDKFIEVAKKKPTELTEDEKIFILKNFFCANYENMILPYKRYKELLIKRGKYTSNEYIKRMLPQFTDQDFLDLQVWFNLTWIDPYWRKNDDFINSLYQKGTNFNEDEKQKIFEKQIQICGKILNKYKELQNKGQIEITISPLYHPIMPLLLNSNNAKISNPTISLPENKISFIEDANYQITEAIKIYEENFEKKPNGMWPSEGSVCEELIPLLYDNGIKWIATDEGILFNSLKKRPEEQLPRELLYLPYNVTKSGKTIQMIFRDRVLSDLIGFVYHRWEPKEAVDDFITHLKNIFIATKDLSDNCLVSIIMDGENCWDSYKNDGWDFLTLLYEKITKEKEWLETVKISDFLNENPARFSIKKLYPGSWINSNFNIWIGHPEDNLAWDYLYETRKILKDYIIEKQDKIGQETLLKTYNEIYIAEGSDWFWWYGEDFTSSFDETFDFLFRKHLMNVYELLNLEIPDKLLVPIKGRIKKKLKILPVDFIEPKIDGRVTSYFEWQAAGMYDTSQAAEMFRTEKIVSKIYFGFNIDSFFLRFDFHVDLESMEFQTLLISVNFIKPENTKIDVFFESPKRVKAKLITEEAEKKIEDIRAEKILELKIPFNELKIEINEPFEFIIVVYKVEKEKIYELERWPYLSTIEIKRPDENFPSMFWSA